MDCSGIYESQTIDLEKISRTACFNLRAIHISKIEIPSGKQELVRRNGETVTGELNTVE